MLSKSQSDPCDLAAKNFVFLRRMADYLVFEQNLMDSVEAAVVWVEFQAKQAATSPAQSIKVLSSSLLRAARRLETGL